MVRHPKKKKKKESTTAKVKAPVLKGRNIKDFVGLFYFIYLYILIVVVVIQVYSFAEICRIKCLGVSSHCGAVEKNLTRNHEVSGLIPGLAQWAKDVVLP